MIHVTATELQYQHGSSDKFYRVYQWDDQLITQYGRNGTVGTFNRTTDMAAYHNAAKKLDEKYAKGYTLSKHTTLTFNSIPSNGDLDNAISRVPGGYHTASAPPSPQPNATVVAPQATVDPDILPWVRTTLTVKVGQRVLGHGASVPLRAMLAETATDVMAEQLIKNDDWCAQPKLDGDRILIEVVDGKIGVYNRAGKAKVSNRPDALLGDFHNLTDGRWVFDGEIVGRKLWLFDFIHADDFVDIATPFKVRHEALAATLEALGVDDTKVGLVTCAYTAQEKTKLLDSAIAESREGIMFRRLSSGYFEGGRSDNLLKYKLLNEADCIVTDLATRGKKNAKLAVFGDEGLINVGSVSTIGKGKVEVGDVVTVQFLYVLDAKAPKMVQPRIVRTRDDKDVMDCKLDQFEDAVTNKDVS